MVALCRRPEVFCEKGVLKNFAKFSGKHLCQSLFFNKVAGGSCEFWKVSKNTFFLQSTSDGCLMPIKIVIVFFPKTVLCYEFRSVCLHYDDKDIHKPSFLTFRTFHTNGKLLFFVYGWWYWKSIIFDIWNSELCSQLILPLHYWL